MQSLLHTDCWYENKTEHGRLFLISLQIFVNLWTLLGIFRGLKVNGKGKTHVDSLDLQPLIKNTAGRSAETLNLCTIADRRTKG